MIFNRNYLSKQNSTYPIFPIVLKKILSKNPTYLFSIMKVPHCVPHWSNYSEMGNRCFFFSRSFQLHKNRRFGLFSVTIEGQNIMQIEFLTQDRCIIFTSSFLSFFLSFLFFVFQNSRNQKVSAFKLIKEFMTIEYVKLLKEI